MVVATTFRSSPEPYIPPYLYHPDLTMTDAATEQRPDQRDIRAATLPPPAQPVYVLRGHSSPIHAVALVRHNSRLLAGDADGWVSLWNLASKRAVAVWRPHQATILGLQEWGDEKIVSQGRDSRLIVWQLRASDEDGLEKKLPVDGATDGQRQPWMLHSLSVNSLNFCAFSACPTLGTPLLPASPDTAHLERGLVIAVPAPRDGQIDIFQLPSEHRLSRVAAIEDVKTGMVMAVHILHHRDVLLLAAGYENGWVALFAQDSSSSEWTMRYHAFPHSQPVLSIDVAPTLGLFYSSSADAIIAQHPLPALRETELPELRQVKTKHSGQQALTVRSDEKIVATAGWDSRIRVYSAKTLKEVAVLKWHTQGCYALSFANLYGSTEPLDGNAGTRTSDQIQTVEQRRRAQVEATHWLAAGSKDGKISLWDIY